ncbi:ABC transporter permease [Roseomonas elaeocarpi]|uniref:ABC transporter permease n=1 Tax=Roseomonas elaeocarpi TaxID=907779 RepID=A0ABV6JPH6_9PROT
MSHYGATGEGFFESLRIQRSVVFAIMMREIQTRFGRHNIGFLWLFLEPLVLGTAVGLIHYASGHTMPGGLDPFLFSLYGYVPFFMFRSVVTRAAMAIQSNMTLLYHRRVTLLDIMMGRNLIEILAILGVVSIMIAATSLFMEMPPANIGQIYLGLGAMAVLCNGLSLLVASASAYWESFERILHPATYLLMPISGAFYAAAWFPPEIRNILLWMPLLHIHEIIREGAFGDHIKSYYSVLYLVEWCIGSNALGLLAMRAVRRHLSFSHG